LWLGVINNDQSDPFPDALRGSDMPTPSELDLRFTYHPPKDGQSEKYERIRAEARCLAATISGLAIDCREASLAITKLEEVVMWANAAIARHGG
jgi:hypothetical protein